MTFFPFFYLGYLLKPDRLISTLKKWWLQLLAAILFILLIVICAVKIDNIYWLRTLLSGRHAYSALEYCGAWGFWFRLVHYIIAILLTFGLIALIPDKKCVISTWGTRTMNVYALHGLFREFFKGDFGFAKRLSIVLPNHLMGITIIISLCVTIFFSLPFWERPMCAILYPSWKESRRQTHT